MDGYGWFDLSEVKARCTRKMTAVLAGELDLLRLLDELMARPRTALAA